MTSLVWIAGLIFYPIMGALVAYLVGTKSKKARDITVNFITVSEFILTLIAVTIFGGVNGVKEVELVNVCGFGLHFALDGFRSIYALVVAFMWMMVTLLSPEYFTKYRNRNRFYAFLLLTLGATMGVFLSTDFFTTFIFFEVMSLTSYVWVAHDEKKEAMRAAETYLGISVLGGMVMLMGIFMLYNSLGTLTFEMLPGRIAELYAGNGLDGQMIAAGICILFGFAVKAGAFPVHIWLPKAHPVAPAPASALLSGVLTKTGIFGIIVVTIQIFGNTEWFGYMLMGIAVATMLLGAVLALFSIDLKRVLACSSLSQIGFILTGLATLALSQGENVLAARGTMIYMVNHSLLKLVLFMVAGVVYMNVHKLDLNEIRGFGRKKPFLHGVFLCGVLGISGIPFFNGYIGKTLIHEGLLETAGVPGWVEPLFLLAGGCTLAYMLKLYICIFIEKNQDAAKQASFEKQKKYLGIPGMIALGGSALPLFVLGVIPGLTADKIMDMGIGFFGTFHESHEVAYFTFHNMQGTFISVGIGLVLYFVFVRLLLTAKNEKGIRVYKNYWPANLDLEDVLYRPVFIRFLPFISGVICRILDGIVDYPVVLLRKTIYKDSPLPHELPEGNAVTHGAAVITNMFVWALNKTFFRKKPIRRPFDHIYAIRWEEFAENNQIIGRSLSYGLILFSMGLVLTIIYLMIVVLW